MIISRIISKLVTPHIYSYYEEHAIVFVSTPLLNVITKIKLFFESSTQDIIESINTSAICNELRAELMEVYQQIHDILIQSKKKKNLNSPHITSLFATEENEHQSTSDARFVRSRLKSVNKDIFTTLCALETALMKRRHGEDQKFFELLSSIDEFQSPYVKSTDSQEGRNRSSTLVDLETNYIPRTDEGNNSDNNNENNNSFTSNFINLFEMIEISGLVIRGIPLLIPRYLEDSLINETPTDIKETEVKDMDADNETNKNNQSNIVTESKIASIESCYLVLTFFSRSGVEKESFQTKYATTGDRNPYWVDTFSTEPVRFSEVLPGGPDPIERLEISLYDRRTVTPATVLYSAVTENILIAKTSIPLELLRLHTINQWFAMTPASKSRPENWHVALHITISMNKKKRIST